MHFQTNYQQEYRTALLLCHEGRQPSFKCTNSCSVFIGIFQTDCVTTGIMILLVALTARSQLSATKVGIPGLSGLALQTCARTSVPNISNDEQAAGQALLLSMPNFTYNPVKAFLGSKKPEVFLNAINYYLPFMVPAVVGLAFLLVISICILPVACCPQSCPTKACRNEEDEYSRCELGWPTVVSLLCMLIAISASLPSLFKSNGLVDSFNYVGCQSQTFLDNSLNGKIDQNGTAFFAGAYLLNTSVTNMVLAGLPKFSNDGQTAYSTASNLISVGTNALNAIASLYSGYTDISYSSVFRDSSAAFLPDVPSKFKSLFLGPLQVNTSVTGVLNSSFQPMTLNVSGTLNPVLTSLSALAAQVAAGTASSNFAGGLLSLKAFNSSVVTFQNQVEQVFGVNDGLSGLKYGLLAFYIIIIVSSLIGISALFAMYSCGLFQFRKFVFCSCGTNFVMSFLGFILAILLGALIPTTNFACSEVGTALLNSTYLSNMLQQLGLPAQQAFALSSAVGDGKFLLNLNENLSRDYNNFKVVFDNSINFVNLTSGYSSKTITASIASATYIINNISQNYYFDITDAAALNWLSILANNQIAISSTCNSNPLADSWVPSFSNPNKTCRAGIVKQQLCTDISSIGTCPLGCYPFSQQLSTSSSGDSNAGLWSARLATRYNLAGAASNCNYATFVYELKNNWDIPRQAAMNNLKSTMNAGGNVIPLLNNYVSEMSVLLGKVNTYSTSLGNTIPETVTPETGTMAGLSSKVLKEDLGNVYAGLCYSVFGSIYFLHSCILVICFSLLVSLPLMVCSVYRHGRMYSYILAVTMKVHPVVDDSKDSDSIID